MSDKPVPSPRYSVWQAVAVAISLAQRAIEEVRSLGGRSAPAGERGPAGPIGKLGEVRGWREEVHYEGSVVAHGGATWQARQDTGREPPHDDWACLAAAGVAGEDGRSFVIRGTWTVTGTYRAMDVVTLGGSSFVARTDAPGPCPGDGWQLIASQGRRGQPGEVGVRGERGHPGSSVISLAVNDQGLLTLTNGDGTSVSCDLYPVLTRALGR